MDNKWNWKKEYGKEEKDNKKERQFLWFYFIQNITMDLLPEEIDL